MSEVETVRINGLRYVVASLRPADIEHIARRVAAILQEDDRAQRDAALEAERRRMVPTEDIEAATKITGGEPFPLVKINGEWREANDD